jgi:hypothetical protein
VIFGGPDCPAIGGGGGGAGGGGGGSGAIVLIFKSVLDYFYNN